MNKTTSIIVGVIAILALVLGVVAYNKTPDVLVGSQGAKGEQGPQGVKGEKGEKGDRGATGPQGPAGKSATTFGSVTGPDSYFPYTANNNQRVYSERKTFSFVQGNGTTTPCAFNLPSATSSLNYASFSNVTSTSTGNLTLTIATSTTAFATTTSVATGVIPSNTTREFGWNAPQIAGGTGVVVPGRYLVFSVGGVGGATGVVISGTCGYEAREI